MQQAKTIGYYVLWFIYYLICFFIQCFINLPWSESMTNNVVVIILILISISSPFLMVPIFLNKLYTGTDRNQHIKRMIDTIGVITLVLLVGTIGNVFLKGFSTSTLSLVPFYVFNGIVMITLNKSKIKINQGQRVQAKDEINDLLSTVRKQVKKAD